MSTVPEADVDKLMAVAVFPCPVEAGTEDVVGVADRKGEVPFSRGETDALDKVAIDALVCDWKGQWLTLGGHLDIVETSVTDMTMSPDNVGVELPLVEIVFTEEVRVEPTMIVVAVEFEAGVLELEAGAVEFKALLIDELELRGALDIALLELKTALEEDDVILGGATLELEGVILGLESLVEELKTPTDDAREADDVAAEELATVAEDTA